MLLPVLRHGSVHTCLAVAYHAHSCIGHAWHPQRALEVRIACWLASSDIKVKRRAD